MHAASSWATRSPAVHENPARFGTIMIEIGASPRKECSFRLGRSCGAKELLIVRRRETTLPSCAWDLSEESSR
jgi:hypothetical protein